MRYYIKVQSFNQKPGKKFVHAVFGLVGSPHVSTFEIQKVLSGPPWGKFFIGDNLQTRFSENEDRKILNLQPISINVMYFSCVFLTLNIPNISKIEDLSVLIF